MDPKVQEAFDQFLAKMQESSIGLVDILEVIAGWLAGGQVALAAAMTNHMRDYLHGFDYAGSEPPPAASVLAEAYRRTFCDTTAAARYGTEHIASRPDDVVGLFQQLTGGLVMFDQAPNKEQLNLALSADTNTAH